MKVAELQSLTKAADVLGYSQPAISHNIISLEERFGFPLFNRNHDRCTLTENGRKMLEYCSQVVRDEEIVSDAVHSINGLLSGSLRLGSICSMLQNFVPGVVFNFTTAYSNNVKFRVNSETASLSLVSNHLGVYHHVRVRSVCFHRERKPSECHRKKFQGGSPSDARHRDQQPVPSDAADESVYPGRMHNMRKAESSEIAE